MEELLDDEIPTIDVEVKTVIVNVEPRTRLTPTMRELNKGIWKKVRVYFYWLFHSDGITFKQYLDSHLTYRYVLDENIHAYHNIDAEKELEELIKMENYKDISDEELDKIIRDTWKEVTKDDEWVIYPNPFDDEIIFESVKKHHKK